MQIYIFCQCFLFLCGFNFICLAPAQAKERASIKFERGNTDDAFSTHPHRGGRIVDCHLSFFHPAVNILSMVSIGCCLQERKSGGAHRSALDRPWLPNKSFVHFSLSLLNSFIYLPRVLPFAKSRINNVCVSFPRWLSCNNRSEDFRATLDEFRAQYWGEIVSSWACWVG